MLESSVVLSAVDSVLNEIDLQKAMRVGEERGKYNLCAIVPGCICHSSVGISSSFPKREERGEISTVFL